jgi:ferredoxin-NADP reductase
MVEWRVATVEAIRPETPTAKTIILRVPDWPGHLAGQHLDVKLTAEDGYSAQRSYSVASADGVELTVQRVEDGEVSPYLTDILAVGDQLEVRGPIGGWFVWRPDPTPVNLVAGGSGVVPLMAMIRARAATGTKPLFRLLYSARTPDDVIYAAELRRRARDDHGLDIAYAYTRTTPDGFRRPAKRLTVADVNTHLWPAEFNPATFLCGPTAFVEKVADMLIALGHNPRHLKTERFG